MITSLQNPHVKNVIKLRSKKAERDKQGLMIVEGIREIKRALDSGVEIKTLYCCQALLKTPLPQIPNPEEVSKPVFEKMAYRDNPEGILAIIKTPSRQLESITLSQNPLVIVAESIEKPGNLGAILRSADAVQADAVLVCDQCTDVNNPNVVRASTGAVFTVPIAECSSEQAIAWLKENKVKILSTTPAAEQEYTQKDLTQPIAIAVGSEQNGLSKKWLEQCDQQLKIPMLGTADSLNASTATSIVLFEALRQRTYL